ncbi:hypothetical protein I79_006645 [Cricetulus griseus]|uniref:Uncharacterized protein n=1 Tax=Cricetulus griseus TaxID=10029 RepID=G3H8E5_CRIGR|nr:hypothetical protein I79_006645 [Cricetulus griseus]
MKQSNIYYQQGYTPESSPQNSLAGRQRNFLTDPRTNTQSSQQTLGTCTQGPTSLEADTFKVLPPRLEPATHTMGFRLGLGLEKTRP